MAQVNLPDRNNVDYNDIPTPSVPYNTAGSQKSRSGFSRWAEDVGIGIEKDIIRPTIRNITNQFIDFIGLSIKNALNSRFGGGYNAPYNSYNLPQNGYLGNAAYNPNRFNEQGYPVVNGYGVAGNSAHNSEPYKNVWFYKKLDAEKTLNDIKDELARNGYITVFKFGGLCHQTWDWSWDNYGWTDLGKIRTFYNIMPKAYDENGVAMPFGFTDIPDPVYIDNRSRR